MGEKADEWRYFDAGILSGWDLTTYVSNTISSSCIYYRNGELVDSGGQECACHRYPSLPHTPPPHFSNIDCW